MTETEALTRDLVKLRAALKDILRVTREVNNNPLEDAYGHAISYIEDVAEKALEGT